MAAKIGRNKSRKNVTAISADELIETANKASYKKDQAKAKRELEKRGVDWNVGNNEGD